ncbi:heavy metal-associated isoprenylated plant protein 7-like isoform X2 [Solanum dulcamara]|uniref:heavy metal-associated isoprenylated plant protein 7-like isoform X2 n=1 Tax=Solanum dulcamara TaxID=45834 RepID=UPI002485EB37|nr:heavy metal-associated isoprenylated plant protein 7-like isoform X2 [Solanum dulcamara]
MRLLKQNERRPNGFYPSDMNERGCYVVPSSTRSIDIERSPSSSKNKVVEDQEAQEIVLKVDMHCEGCARKVAKALKGIQGVEGVTTDYKTSKVVVKGKNADPLKVCERAERKSGRKVELISPLKKTPDENIKEEDIKKEEEPKEEKKDEPPPEITVVLNIQMHCDACAQVLQKRIRKIKGVECVTTDLEISQVIVKGVNIDPEKLANDVYKTSGKQVSVVNNIIPIEEKKEEEEEEKEEEKGEDIMKNYNLAQKYNNNMEYYANYSPEIFSDDNPHACSLM